MVCVAVKKDGTPCKAQAKRDGLCIGHMNQTTADNPALRPAKLKDVRRARNLRNGHRRVKMLRPICDEGCQAGAEVAWDWYTSCPHDPYVGKRQKITQVPVYSEPHEDGSVTIQGVEDHVSWSPYPHFAEVSVSTRVNSGQGVERARRKGWIAPEELRSPLYPRGIAPMCEFKGCQWQEGLVTYRFGVFCREMEAKLVGFDEHDSQGNPLFGALEVMHQAKRQKQLDAVTV